MPQSITEKSGHSHFIPIELTQNEKTFEFLLPAFPMPFSFLQENSFYKCENILFSIQKDDKMIDISLFNKVDSEKTFALEGKWDWNWRKSGRGFNFGRYTKSIDNNDEILIRVMNGIECNFKISDL